MTLKASLIVVFSLYSTLFYAQEAKPASTDSAEVLIEKRYKGGAKAFFTDMSQCIRYPMAAREQCRTGVVLVDMKIRPTGTIDSILFRNDVEIGAGIEDELARCLLATKGKWVKSVEYTTLTFSVAFQIGEKNKLKAFLSVVAYGFPATDCTSTQALIKAFEKAKKKNKYKEALELCEDILRQMPNSEEYKKELAELNAKLNK